MAVVLSVRGTAAEGSLTDALKEKSVKCLHHVVTLPVLSVFLRQAGLPRAKRSDVAHRPTMHCTLLPPPSFTCCPLADAPGRTKPEATDSERVFVPQSHQLSEHTGWHTHNWLTERQTDKQTNKVSECNINHPSLTAECQNSMTYFLILLIQSLCIASVHSFAIVYIHFRSIIHWMEPRPQFLLRARSHNDLKGFDFNSLSLEEKASVHCGIGEGGGGL